eukprot:TRINITY_DN3079_c0_g2_i1.p1 TRINITY_DN3079_c0_g2~~TRINITY_DN3079_c0_g2_i1.p1  ORF type:complete len:357 (+),score=74.50 TRINITY_DN3079_c0_g2_i1:27-1097(+)
MSSPSSDDLEDEIKRLEELADEAERQANEAVLERNARKAEMSTTDGMLTKRVTEVKQLKSAASILQRNVEEEEEYISNGLMKRLDTLQKEKAKLVHEVEVEEEFLMNSLQKQLIGVGTEKKELEQHLRRERDFIVNKLEKQLKACTDQNRALERRIDASKEANLLRHLNAYKEQIDDSDTDSTYSGSQQGTTSCLQKLNESATTRLQGEIERLQRLCMLKEQQAASNAENCESLRQQLEQMSQSNFLQDLKTHRLREEYHKASGERNRLLLNTEVLSEHNSNISSKRMPRRTSSSSSSLNGLRAHTELILSSQAGLTPPATPHLSPQSTSGASTPLSRPRLPNSSFGRAPPISPLK